MLEEDLQDFEIEEILSKVSELLEEEIALQRAFLNTRNIILTDKKKVLVKVSQRIHQPEAEQSYAEKSLILSKLLKEKNIPAVKSISEDFYKTSKGRVFTVWEFIPNNGLAIDKNFIPKKDVKKIIESLKNLHEIPVVESLRLPQVDYGMTKQRESELPDTPHSKLVREGQRIVNSFSGSFSIKVENAVTTKVVNQQTREVVCHGDVKTENIVATILNENETNYSFCDLESSIIGLEEWDFACLYHDLVIQGFNFGAASVILKELKNLNLNQEIFGKLVFSRTVKSAAFHSVVSGNSLALEKDLKSLRKSLKNGVRIV